MSEWTPGPWSKEWSSVHGYRMYARDLEDYDPLAEEIWREADARLISKAPEMAAILSSIVDIDDLLEHTDAGVEDHMLARRIARRLANQSRALLAEIKGE